MAVYSPITESDLLSLLEQYDIGSLIKFEGILEGIENTNYKVTTSQNNYILTIFEKRVEFKDIPFFINLKKHLAAKKFLCPKPVSDIQGKNINTLKNKSCVLVSFLNGKKVTDITNTHCQQVGEVLASLHLQTKDFNEKRLNSMSYTEWKNIFLKCKNHLNQDFIHMLPIVEEELVYLKNHWPNDLPSGIVHADVFKDNVFFKKNIFSGLIDFYFSCNDFLAYDIALAINAWCFDEQNLFNKDRYQSLINGYESQRKLTNDEKKYFSVLLRGASIRILITRLHDQLFHLDNAFVKPKDPNEYLAILKFHQQINFREYF
jgi:homoserine kinase type II